MSVSTDLYCANTCVNYDAIKDTVRFALNTDSDDDFSNFLAGLVNGKKTSILAMISRGKSKAHEYIKRDILATFNQFCTSDCPLRTGSNASDSEAKQFVNTVLNS